MTAMGALTAMGSNVLSSVLLVLANKRAVTKDGFDFMIVLTGLHSYASFMCCLLLLLLGKMYYKPVKNYWYLLRISGASLLSIVFMNLNLKHNSVGFYQISKMLCIPVSLLLETMFGLRKQQLTQEILASLLLILTGMYLVINGEVKYHTSSGLLFMSLGVFFTSVAQIWFAPLQKELELDSIQLLFHTSPIMAFLSFAVTPICEDSRRLMDFNLTRGVIGDIAGSCLMAFLLNLSNYKVLELTSPLTYQVIGHVKTVAILLAGVLFFDEMPSRRTNIGITVSIIGMALYGHERNNSSASSNAQQAEQQAKRPKSANSGDHNTSHRSHKPHHLRVDSSSPTSLSSPISSTAGTSPLSSPDSSQRVKMGRSHVAPHTSAPESTQATQTASGNTAAAAPAAAAKYQQAVQDVKALTATDNQKLAMYGFFKYVEVGKCNTPRPTGWTDLVGKAKWDAWNEIDASLSKSEVMQKYIDLVESIKAAKA